MRGQIGRYNAIALLTVITLAAWPVTGCTDSPAARTRGTAGPVTTAGSIPFDSLAQADSYTAGLDTLAIFVAGSAAEATRFSGWLHDSDAARVQAADFAATWVVAVFRGQMGSSGHGIAVRDVSFSQGEVRLMVDLLNPAPGRGFADVITYPYHIVLVPREPLSVPPGTVWAVYTPDGTRVAYTTHP